MKKNFIVEWILGAEGKYDIDLAESGIQYHYIHNLKIDKNWNLNYSSDNGNTKLREKIAKLYGVDKENVLITNGSQEALYLFYNSFLTMNDEVIAFSPGWQQSWEVTKNIGCKVRILKLNEENRFRIKFE